MRSPPAAGVVQGLAYLSLVTAALALGGYAWERAQGLRLPPAEAPICTRPVAVETAVGLQLGCASEARLAVCHPRAFDRVVLHPKGCERQAGGMPAGWLVTLGLRLNINRAQAQDLQALPHVGPATAQAIVQHRLQHGPYRSVEALGAVAGVGAGRIESLRPFITVTDGG